MKIVYTHVPTFLTQPHFNLDFMAYRLLIFVNLILSLGIIEMFIGQTPWILSKFSIWVFLPSMWIFKKFTEWPLLHIILK